LKSIQYEYRTAIKALFLNFNLWCSFASIFFSYLYIHFGWTSTGKKFMRQIFILILKLFVLTNWYVKLIDWCLMPSLAVFQLYRGMRYITTEEYRSTVGLGAIFYSF